MAGLVTVDTIRSIIEGNMEDTDRADRILEAIRKHDGKLLTKTVVAKIAEDTGESVYICRQYGMTHLKFGGYGNPQSDDRGMSLLLAHSETNVYVNAVEIEKRNTAYYSAAKERNAARRAALANKESLQRAVNAINMMNSAKEEFRELTKYGAALYTDMHSLNNLIDSD